MSLQGSSRWPGGQGGREGLSLRNPRSNTRVLSTDRGQAIPPRESLESALSSALRSEDTETRSDIGCVRRGFRRAGVGRAEHAEPSKCSAATSLVCHEAVADGSGNSVSGGHGPTYRTLQYNRRGFLASATHQLKLAHRNAQDVLLLFSDVDNLKKINDSFGHKEGDLALVRAADALEQTFRDSDILARLGGDEFAALASEASIPDRQAIVPRFEASVAKANAGESRYDLSFSIGIARFDPETPASLGELMARVDRDMYVHERKCHPKPIRASKL
jgi:diguanylate cyclase (GGDEF)-like protein